MKREDVLVISMRLAVLLMVAVLSGCATPALWKEKNRIGTFAPADNPRIALYESSQPSDVLVVFEQHIVNSDAQTRRAYYLFVNEPVIVAGGKPQFVSPAKVDTLPQIPMRSPEEPVADCLVQSAYCAVMKPQGDGFQLYRDQDLVGDYKLPKYAATKNLTGRILLTPLAVGADAVITGAVLFTLGAAGAAH